MLENRRSWKRVFLGLVATFVLYGVVEIPSLYGDFLWFAALGYESVFLTFLAYWIGLFVLTGATSFGILEPTIPVNVLSPDENPTNCWTLDAVLEDPDGILSEVLDVLADEELTLRPTPPSAEF